MSDAPGTTTIATTSGSSSSSSSTEKEKEKSVIHNFNIATMSTADVSTTTADADADSDFHSDDSQDRTNARTTAHVAGDTATTSTSSSNNSHNNNNNNKNNNSRIVFASCNSQLYEQVLWEPILARNISAFIWGGDAIYADDNNNDMDNNDEEKEEKEKIVTPAKLQRLYQQQKQDPGYSKLLASGIVVGGVLDDHDYGQDNGDKTYKYRTESGIAFACGFLQEQQQHDNDHQKGGRTAMCHRARKGLGVYGVMVMDFSRPPGQQLLTEQEAGLDPDVVVLTATSSSSSSGTTPDQQKLSNRSVAIFLLDIRSNKSPYTKTSFWDSNDSSGDFLGPTQWEWLQEALGRTTASVNIIVSGLQVLADRMGPPQAVENWGKFPTAQRKLYQLVLQDNVRAPIIVSGDVHHAQILKKDCVFVEEERNQQQQQQQQQQENDFDDDERSRKVKKMRKIRPLHEVTTSGMTHAWGGPEICGRQNAFLCKMRHFVWAGRISMTLGHWINAKRAWTDLLMLDDVASTKTTKTRRTGTETEGSGSGSGRPLYSIDLNFAEFDFDWDDESVTIRILGSDKDAPPAVSTKWRFDSLTVHNDNKNDVENNNVQEDDNNDLPWMLLVREQEFTKAFDALMQHGRDTIIRTSPNNNINGGGSYGEWICIGYRGPPSQLHAVIGFVVPVFTFMFLSIVPLFLPPFLLLLLCLRRYYYFKKKLPLTTRRTKLKNS